MKTVDGAALMTAEQLLAGGSRFKHCELWDGKLVVREPAGGCSGPLGNALGPILRLEESS